MIRLWLGFLVLLGGLLTAHAVDVTLATGFANGFWLRHGPIATYDLAHLYGESSSSGTWSIMQWGQPLDPTLVVPRPPRQVGRDMTPFRLTPCPAGQSNCFQAWSPDAYAKQYTLIADGKMHMELGGQGINLPCSSGAGGYPYEFDNLVAPNDQQNYPSYPNALVSPPTGRLALNTLLALRLNGTITPKIVARAQTPPCTVQAAKLIFSLVFNNTVSSETLFYQLSIMLGPDATSTGSYTTVPCDPNLHPTPPCPGGPIAPGTPRPGAFIFGDDLRAYNGPLIGIPVGATTILSLDMLPRILQIIAVGAARSDAAGKLDGTIANWSQGGMYYGHILYGKVAMVTDFSDLTLVGTQ